MKGRVYDPTLARFTSADPFIQAPLHSQSFNRYAYVWNNPLNYKDPSGYLLGKLVKGISKIGKSIIKNTVKIITDVAKEITKNISALANTLWTFSGARFAHKYLKKQSSFYRKYNKVILATAIAIAAPYAYAAVAGVAGGVGALSATQIVAAGAIGGAVSGYVATGTLKGALTGAISGAAFAGVGAHFRGIANSNLANNAAAIARNVPADIIRVGSQGLTTLQTAAQIASHAVVGGAMSVLRGGKFLTGAISAGVSKAFAPTLSNIREPGFEVAASALIGGATSKLTGGSFEDGALIGAFSNAFNEQLTKNELANRIQQKPGEDFFESKGGGWLYGTYHEYHHADAICQVGPSCDPAAMGAELNERGIYPGQTGPIKSGKISDAVGLPGYNPIVTTLDSDGVGGTNVTYNSEHILHPGTVVRDLLVIDNTVYIYTYGEGRGAFGAINNFNAPGFWSDVNDGVFGGK